MICAVVLRLLIVAACVWLSLPAPAQAGMPAPLPTSWTVDNPPEGYGAAYSSNATDARWQAISFFIACLLLSAWGVKILWNALQREFTWLPGLGYGRALSFVVLWGLAFVIVLTMISGARELMTPGAWKKQGWTYRLANAGLSRRDTRDVRRDALLRLRHGLWHYAATHDGQFPARNDPEFDRELWEIPGWGGLQFLYRPDQRVDGPARLLAFEPELEGDERLVLLTSGLVGTMRTAEIERMLSAEALP